ncbi:hypothetical protein [Microbacterium sp. CFBP9034]|uniref:hypothetical protein n=1 Tax=Microbacterium sp. CFBP9034 TaxID=3096540 RepID=UPI002A6A36E9|nr:hypothetical protein [Microbacterium sp. CFBP9034]MDY0908845.1 hypothetical protein [Microbacterium sp. CFBP9034]
MKIDRVRVDGQMFILEPGQDVGSLQDQILAAARDGAGFVQFDTVGRSRVSVLITPRVAVRFEVIERDAEQLADWERNPPTIDLPRNDYDFI